MPTELCTSLTGSSDTTMKGSMTLSPLLLDVSKQLFTVTSSTCISLKVMLLMLLWWHLRFGFCACDVKHQGSNVAPVQIPVSTRGLSLLLVRSLAQRCFSPGTPVFPSPPKPTLPNCNSIWNTWTCLSEFLRTYKYFMGEQITIYNYSKESFSSS